MAVNIVDAGTGFSLAAGLKLKELHAKYPIDSEFQQFINQEVLPSFPDLLDKQVVAVYTDSKLAFHINVPDEENAPAPVQHLAEAEETRSEVPAQNPSEAGQ